MAIRLGCQFPQGGPVLSAAEEFAQAVPGRCECRRLCNCLSPLHLGLPPEERLEGTAAACACAIRNGADIIRVHDVREMARVARMTDAIVRGWPGEPSGGAA